VRFLGRRRRHLAENVLAFMPPVETERDAHGSVLYNVRDIRLNGRTIHTP